MRGLLRLLGADTLGSLRDLAPILLVIAFFQLIVLRQPFDGIATLAGGGLLVVVGLTLFIFGLKLALFPIGETLAYLDWLDRTLREAAGAGLTMTEVMALPIDPRFDAIALSRYEFARTVAHLYSQYEQQAF